MIFYTHCRKICTCNSRHTKKKIQPAPLATFIYSYMPLCIPGLYTVHLYLEGCSYKCMYWSPVNLQRMNVTHSMHSDIHLSSWIVPPLGRMGNPLITIPKARGPKLHPWSFNLHDSPEWYTVWNMDWTLIVVNHWFLKVSCDDMRSWSSLTGISDMQAADINVSWYFSTNFTLRNELHSPM